jgi:hypothetical protein
VEISTQPTYKRMEVHNFHFDSLQLCRLDVTHFAMHEHTALKNDLRKSPA